MYGENGGQLRDALGVLLRQHRIQQRLGGKGNHTVPESTTVAEREELGEQIRRYRTCILTWALQAVIAVDPKLGPGDTTRRLRGPTAALHHRLNDALAASDVGLATSDELTTEHPFATVESWREAARAAALGEHDFPAGVGYGRLDAQQRMTVLKDAADIVRGLIVLDRRYDRVPGWQKLHNRGRLGQAAEACAEHARTDEPDYTVDRRGWQPTPQPIDGPAKPGLDGVLQAQYDLLLQLAEFPDAHSLRVVMDSQRIVSHEGSHRISTTEPELAAKWTTRKETYAKLVRETRDLGGNLGTPHAAGLAAVAARRAQKLSHEPNADTGQLRQLDRIFTHTDERVSAAVEHGVKHRFYFLRVNAPGLDNHDGQLVRVNRSKYIPITSPVQSDLVRIVRQELRPDPIRPHPPPGAAQSRLELEEAIKHRPTQRGANPDAPSI